MHFSVDMLAEKLPDALNIPRSAGNGKLKTLARLERCTCIQKTVVGFAQILNEHNSLSRTCEFVIFRIVE